MNCPKCGIENDDNWSISINGKIECGGCQICWENESDDAWWDAMESVYQEEKNGTKRMVR